MEDFDAFAAALGSGISELRGCLIASGDGHVLGAYPNAGATGVEDAWGRLETLRECDSAFIQFGAETWCSVRRGTFVAFAVIGPSADLGAVSEHMEQVLVAAEQTRALRRQTPADLPSPPTSDADIDDDDEDEIDRIALVREFSQLLQDNRGIADG